MNLLNEVPACASSSPLHEAGELDPNGETLLPDVDGLQQAGVPQLGRHVVHVEDPGMLTGGEQDGVWDLWHRQRRLVVPGDTLT